MLARRALLFIAMCSLIMPWSLAPAAAGDAAATAFVTKIYDAYKGKDAKGINWETAADLRRYFEPSLVELIFRGRKAAAKRQEVPTLDGDPFISAQEWEVATFDIAVTDVSPDKAAATVTYKNFDMPMKLVLTLVKVKNDWRIADIVTTREGQTESLRGLFKH